MGNLELERKRHPSTFRKLAVGTWDDATAASVYGAMTLRMEPALAYIEAFRAATGRHLTVTHLMGRAVARVLADVPDANAILRGKHIYLRKDVAIFFQVAMQDPVTGELDLSGLVLRSAQTRSLAEIVDEFTAAAAKVKARRDRSLEGTRSLLSRLPTRLVGPMLKATGYLAYEWNLDLRRLGVPRDAFGSAMITNIGSLGLESAFAPLIPYSRVPLILALGAVEDTPVVDGDRVVPGKTMRVCATFDHRLLDGAHAARMARVLRAHFADPFAHYDPLPGR